MNEPSENMASSALPEIKTSKNTYHVDYMDVIGHGGFGTIYKAYDLDKKPIALKIGKRTNAKIHEENWSFIPQHPNIIAYFDLSYEEENMLLFMEYCPFRDLTQFFKIMTISAGQKVAIMTQIASAVVSLHNSNIIHRDIKPGNILVARVDPLQVKLCDFHLSKFQGYSESEEMTSDVGTLLYKAPEFWARNKDGKLFKHNRKVDIFSCGLTFLAILQISSTKTCPVPLVENCSSLTADEVNTPIGFLMYLRFVHTKAVPNLLEPNGSKLELQVKSVTRRMIEYKAYHRSSADQVFKQLNMIEVSLSD